MPDNVDIGGQSTIPVVSVADGRAVVRLNRPREQTGSSLPTSAFCATPLVASTPIRRSAS